MLHIFIKGAAMWTVQEIWLNRLLWNRNVNTLDTLFVISQKNIVKNILGKVRITSFQYSSMPPFDNDYGFILI